MDTTEQPPTLTPLATSDMEANEATIQCQFTLFNALWFEICVNEKF